jgi:uncharacterized protein
MQKFMIDSIFDFKFKHMRHLYLLTFSLLLLLSGGTHAQINFNSPSFVYLQDFNSLPTSGTTNAFTLTGWRANRSEIRAGNGSANAGAFYSFGATDNNERAIGSLTSVAQNFIVFGFELRNNTGTALTAVNVTFTGELWRLGNRNLGGAALPDTLYFDYSTTATGIDDSTATWNLVPALFFVSPDTTGDNIAVDGNDAKYRKLINGNFEVAVPNGNSVWLRWNNTRFTGEVAGAKDGLAIDDLRVSVNTGTIDPPVCERPVSQDAAAQNLNLSTSNDTLLISFEAGQEPVSGYLVTVTKTLPAGNPQDGTSYAAGNQIGASTVVSVGTGTNTFFTPITEGTYTVNVYAFNVCDEVLYGVIETAAINYNPSTFVRNNDLAPGFSIFPNPTSKGYLNIRFSEQITGLGEFQLFNTAGAQVAAWRTALANQMQLNLPTLPTGQYLLLLHQNGLYRTEKMIIGE